MKDEYKVIIGVIIVALVILVGAYELSGSNTVSPGTTASGNTTSAGILGIGNTTSTTGATSGVEATPVPRPESGVRQTEFGYWITYPPLGEQTWSGPSSSGGAGGSDGSNGGTGGAGSTSSAYFPQTSGSVSWSSLDSGNADIATDTYPVSIQVKRTGTAGALSVSYTISHTNMAYTYPASGTVTFSAGSDVAYINLNLPFTFVSFGGQDTITISLSNGAQYTLHVNT